MESTSISIAALGIVATCVGGLIWIIKQGMNKILPVLEGMTAALNTFNKVIEDNSKQVKNNTEYLQHRNGRDSEIWQEVRDSLIKIHEDTKPKDIVVVKPNKARTTLEPVLGRRQRVIS